MMDVECGQRSVGARPILDDDRLAEYRTELVTNDPADRIAGAAGSEHGHNRDRSRWVIFGVKRRAEQCRHGGCANEDKLFHHRSSQTCRDHRCEADCELPNVAAGSYVADSSRTCTLVPMQGTGEPMAIWLWSCAPAEGINAAFDFTEIGTSAGSS